MTRLELVQSLSDEIKAVAYRFNGISVSVFGSVARGEDTSESDIDFLIDFAKGSSLFDIIDIQDELENLLQCPVDIVAVGGLKDRDDHIRQEAIPL
ncbi:MAG: nucleotidyltransferase family protein [Actinomycetes bacterium]